MSDELVVVVEVKPYDPGVLVAKLKAHGIDLGGQAAHALIEELFTWLKESAELSATPFDNVAIPVLSHLKDAALAKIDEILPPDPLPPSGAV